MNFTAKERERFDAPALSVRNRTGFVNLLTNNLKFDPGYCKLSTAEDQSERKNKEAAYVLPYDNDFSGWYANLPGGG